MDSLVTLTLNKIQVNKPKKESLIRFINRTLSLHGLNHIQFTDSDIKHEYKYN